MIDTATLVVVPAFNEEDTVATVVRRVREMDLLCLVVDDGSSDATSALASDAGATVVTHPTNIGVGGAMRTGFRYAVDNGFDRVVQVDADLQHPPESIPDLLVAADDGWELVIGSRFGGEYETPGHRRLAMRVVASVVSRRVGTRLDDVTSGFRAISDPLLSRFAESYPAEYLGDTVEAVLQAHAYGASIKQVPVSMEQRAAGEATSAFAAGGHLARMTVAIVAGKPQRMSR